MYRLGFYSVSIVMEEGDGVVVGSLVESVSGRGGDAGGLRRWGVEGDGGPCWGLEEVIWKGVGGVRGLEQ